MLPKYINVAYITFFKSVYARRDVEGCGGIKGVNIYINTRFVRRVSERCQNI
jgi:hypothetical protein